MKKTITIKIGGDMDKDDKELLTDIKKARQTTNILYLDSYEQLYKLLSPKKLDLLRYLIENQDEEKPKTVTQVATETKRQQEAISRDLHKLVNFGLVTLKKIGQTVYPIPRYQAINIQLA